MPTQQERRDSERVSCNFVCPLRLTKPAGAGVVKLIERHGYAINRSSRGMLLLVPEKVNTCQVLEIQAPSEVKTEPCTKLVEVCWTRPIAVDAGVKLYLAGTCVLFEFPTPRQSSQTC